MKQAYRTFLAIFCALLFSISLTANAQLLYRAFVEGQKPIPDDTVEDPAAWNKNVVTNGALQFSVQGGRLKQTANGCAQSGKVTIPDPTGKSKKWKDYTVIVDYWDRDNDSVSVLFRYEDEDNYYNFTIGAGDFGNTWYLGDSTAKESDCFDGGAPSLATGKNPVPLDESGNTAYTVMVRVKGDTIELFFGEQVPVKDLMKGKTPEKVAEVSDSKHKQGTVGLHMGSNPADFANILVFGPGGPRPVDPAGSLSTTWALLKSSY